MAKKNKKKRIKQTAYEVFLREGLTLPDGTNSRIVFSYADAVRLMNSNKRRGKKGKKGIHLFDRIVPIPMTEITRRVSERMETMKQVMEAEQRIEAETEIQDLKTEEE